MPYVPTRDIITYYEEAGSGDPLVLIMGLGGDLQGWALTAPALAKQFRVITYDNRGAGRTSAPDKPYTIAGMADDLAALLDELKVSKAHVLGYSMGGMIAQEFALNHTNRVEKLILLATSPGLDGYSRTIVRNWINVRRSNMSRELIVRNNAPFVYTAELLDDTQRFERAIQNSVANPYAQQDHAYIRQAEAVLGFSTADRLGNIKAETLIVTNRDDILVPPRNGKKLNSGISGSKLLELEGAHAGVIEYPNEHNEKFLEFLGAAVPA
jgi:pimeloyl-ACP methyl ester carboxylesterase